MLWLLLSLAHAAPRTVLDARVHGGVTVSGGGAASDGGWVTGPRLPLAWPPGARLERAWLVVHGLPEAPLDALRLNGVLARAGATVVHEEGDVAVLSVEPSRFALGRDNAWESTDPAVRGVTLLATWVDDAHPGYRRVSLVVGDGSCVDGWDLPTPDDATGDGVLALSVLDAEGVEVRLAGVLSEALPEGVDGEGLSAGAFGEDPELVALAGHVLDGAAGPWRLDGLGPLSLTPCARLDAAVVQLSLDGDGDGLSDEEDDCTVRDADDDGFPDGGYVLDGCDALPAPDCDDDDPAVHPGAAEIPGDGVDSDCDGEDGCDGDGDGWRHPDCGGLDCDDTSAEVHPGASDQAGDGVDADCDGDDSCDEDGDGHLAIVCGGDDCDDARAWIHGGAEDVAGDGWDADCDGDDSCDEDGDEFRAPGCGGTDCDDHDPDVHRLAEDIPYDGVDSDCDGVSDFDADADGHDAIEHGGDDCDDRAPSVHPGAEDPRGDRIDANCDGADGVAGEGCGCASTPPVGWLWLAPLLLLYRASTGPTSHAPTGRGSP